MVWSIFFTMTEVLPSASQKITFYQILSHFLIIH